jgi:hypothetical protein
VSGAGLGDSVMAKNRVAERLPSTIAKFIVAYRFADRATTSFPRMLWPHLPLMAPCFARQNCNEGDH